MAEQSKPPGKCRSKTHNICECEPPGSSGHSKASGGSSGGGGGGGGWGGWGSWGSWGSGGGGGWGSSGGSGGSGGGSGGSGGSSGSEGPREKRGRISSQGKQHSGSKWGSGSRHFSRTTRFTQDDDDDRNEGPETSGFRYSTHSSRFKRERWWEQGGSRLSVPVKQREPSISDQNPPSKQWFKVTIPNGKMYDKEWLLSQIQDKCSVPFTPIEFHYENNIAHFFVEDANTASALKAVDHRIIDYDRRRVSIIINSSGPPLSVQNELKPQQVEQLKVIMSKKYDSSQKSLDLKGLRSDPELMAQNIDIVLSRKNFMSASIQIIGENIPQLLALNMSNNRIYKLDDFSEILKVAPNLKILNLSSNELKSEQELDKVKGLQLRELWLEGNPLCKVFPDRSSYLSAIRKRFPKLLRLDGCELPPPIAFDIETPTTLPSCKGSYFGSETIKGMVLYFLQQYYSVYDAENRQGLLDAYHEGACCSLSLPISSSRHNFNEYMENNRNVKNLKDPCLQFRLLKHSRLTVVAFLNKLPKTQHDMNSFVVDVCAQTETLLCFSVHGIFKEIHEKSEDTIRAFTRVFVAIPSSNATGMCMVNDELFVRNANSTEIHNSFATPAVPIPAPSSMATVIQQKQDMMQTFSMQSGMNLEWSQKCLEDNNWDFAQAAQIFMQLKAEGKIPAVAFLK